MYKIFLKNINFICKNIKYIAILFIYYFIFLSILFFFSPFLEHVKNINLTTIGFLTPLGLTAIIPASLIWGFIVDKHKTPKIAIIINLLLTITIFIGLIFSNNKTFLCFLFVLSYPTYMMLVSLIDGVILNNFEQKNYSKIRAFGSLGAAFSYFTNSYVLNSISYSILLTFQLLLLIALIILILFTNIKHKEKEKVEYFKTLKKLKNYPQILLILIIAFLTYGVLSADDPYTTDYNTIIVGIPALIYGITGFLSTFLEGSLMYFYNFFTKKLNVISMLSISTITLFIIYFSKYALSEYPIIIILGNIALGIFISLFIPSVMIIINEYSDTDIKNTVLGLYQSSMKLSAIIIGYVTAIYYSNTSSFTGIYFIHTSLIALSFIFLIILAFTMKNKK